MSCLLARARARVCVCVCVWAPEYITTHLPTSMLIFKTIYAVYVHFGASYKRISDLTGRRPERPLKAETLALESPPDATISVAKRVA